MINNLVKFLPLLIFYFLILAIPLEDIKSDEIRFLEYANNLTQGYFTPKDDVVLLKGPGYPLFLLPFVFLKASRLIMFLTNPLFLFLSVLYFYAILKIYIKKKAALFFSYIFGLYPPFLKYIPILIYEIFSVFLICGFMYHFCMSCKCKKNFYWHLFIGSFYLGFLALTKVLFGYVILISLLFLLIVYLFKKVSEYKKSLLFFSLAILLCLPYLLDTYSLTGKIFYWGSSGGWSLYWMSSPFKSDLGDWHSIREVYESHELSKNHKLFHDEIASFSWVKKDEAMKKKAMENIINNPRKYFKNWLCNIG